MLTKSKKIVLESMEGWGEYLDSVQNPDPSGKKQQLLEMARNGEPKCQEKNLRQSLFRYTSKNSKSYDLKFDIEIRRLRPDWFITHYDIANGKKEQLLEMARHGEPKPKWKTKLGKSLVAYTSPGKSLVAYTSPGFDPEFNKQIRGLRPDWFISASDVKKEQLLEMARNGKDRPPSQKTKLGVVLIKYTCKSKSNGTYDPEFDAKIRELRPDWFVNQSHIANEKKQQLLEMAKNGEPRPVARKCNLGMCLCKYTNKNKGCYDPEFDAKIRKLAPHWFVDTVSDNKKKLLKMARNGEPRPNKKTGGSSLVGYTSKKDSCYDPEFDAEIRMLAPHWFRKFRKQRIYNAFATSKL